MKLIQSLLLILLTTKRKTEMQKYNASNLLYEKHKKERFLNRMNVKESELLLMKQAKVKVRRAITQEFSSLSKKNIHLIIDKQLTTEQLEEIIGIKPKFKSQGSSVYKTQNIPAHNPPQEVDVDDGVYLPITFFQKKPIIGKKIFFKIVDSALKKLARRENWTFIEKRTCSRIQISNSMHFDVPIYVASKSHIATLKAETLLFSESIDESREIVLEEGEVYLGLRNNEHWTISDPKLISDWFNESKKYYGDSLTRLCRYLKAWRDYKWETGGPSSITLMICVTETFDNRGPFRNDSDALINIFDALSTQLLAGVKNPKVEDEVIFPRGISDTEKAEICAMASESSNIIKSVLYSGTTKQSVVNGFISVFGDRIPNEESWVEYTSPADQVKSTPRIKTNYEPVPNLTSG